MDPRYTVALVLITLVGCSTSTPSGELSTQLPNRAPIATLTKSGNDPILRSGVSIEGDYVTFSSIGSTDPDGDYFSYQWYVDGNLENTDDFKFYFYPKSTGVYEITLVLVDAYGLESDPVMDTVTWLGPKGGFWAGTTSQGYSIQLWITPWNQVSRVVYSFKAGSGQFDIDYRVPIFSGSSHIFVDETKGDMSVALAYPDMPYGAFSGIDGTFPLTTMPCTTISGKGYAHAFSPSFPWNSSNFTWTAQWTSD